MALQGFIRQTLGVMNRMTIAHSHQPKTQCTCEVPAKEVHQEGLRIAPGKTGAILNPSWWTSFAGTSHVHWVFGWWEWAIVILFMTPNVWRMKPWSAITVSYTHLRAHE